MQDDREKRSAGGSEIKKVLVVDDEPLILTTVAAILESEEIDVLTAPDGREALAIFGDRKDEISALIVDLNMPHMGGEDLLRRIREIDPDARAIFVSGYDEDRLSQEIAEDGRLGFVHKPFAIDLLLTELRKVAK